MLLILMYYYNIIRKPKKGIEIPTESEVVYMRKKNMNKRILDPDKIFAIKD